MLAGSVCAEYEEDRAAAGAAFTACKRDYEEPRAPMVVMECIKNAVRPMGAKARISTRKLTRKNPCSEKTGVYQQSEAAEIAAFFCILD